MLHRGPLFAVALVLLVCTLIACRKESDNHSRDADLIRRYVASSDTSNPLLVLRIGISSPTLVRRLYQANDHHPAWGPCESLAHNSRQLIDALQSVRDHGLSPESYATTALAKLSDAFARSPCSDDSVHMAQRVVLDMALTDAFMTCATHLYRGECPPHILSPPSADTTFHDHLIDALRKGAWSEALRDYAPNDSQYVLLQSVLRQHLAAPTSVNWVAVPGGRLLRYGASDARVLLLRKRLTASGDLIESTSSTSALFDSAVSRAVYRFQWRHGLDQTGTADSITLAALNVPLDTRVGQIIANLERLRWNRHEKIDVIVRVNIGDQMMYVLHHGRDVLSMKAVIGLRNWPTPLFRSSIDRIVFNPTWMSPHHILVTEMITYMKADSNYLSYNKMTLLRGEGSKQTVVDPKTIDWKLLQPADVDFRLRQEPGDGNIMGRVKFLTPNEFDIFLHDTPYREDFPKRIRLASHGCVRLERAFDFAEYLLRTTPGWSRRRIDTVVARRRELSVTLHSPVPVEVVYRTVWVDQEMTSHFREDVYGLDEQLARRLQKQRKTNLDEGLTGVE